MKEYTRETLLTTVAELQSKLGSPNLCIIDVRPAEDYAKGHIPGATHFDLFGLSLVDTSDAPLKAFMFMIHHVLELRGVSESKEVVFYEDNSGMRAARGLWFLEYYGHPNVKMLDGGFQAWKAAGAPLTSDATPPIATSLCACSAFRKSATTSAPGKSGATAPICRSKFPSQQNDLTRAHLFLSSVSRAVYLAESKTGNGS